MRALCLPFLTLLLLLVNTGAQAIVLVAAELPPMSFAPLTANQAVSPSRSWRKQPAV